MMAPCVLWVDEIEKGLASDSNDSGTSKRALGTFLTWMAERKTLVFLVATANDIQNLPPELMRKGRMDEIFFVDLPDYSIRKEILEIHLKKRELNPSIGCYGRKYRSHERMGKRSYCAGQLIP